NVNQVDFENIFSNLENVEQGTRTLIIKSFAGENFTVFKNTNFKSNSLTGGKLQNRSDSDPLQEMKSYIESLYKNKIDEIEVLKEYDNYYYARKMKRALPVLKMKFNNPSETIFYIDPLQKKLVKTNNKYSRIRRWLYKGLHSLDFSFIYYSRLWEPAILLLMAGGTILSFTGVIFLYKRMKRKAK
ncbi:MAG: hypothetical protein ACEPO8_11945, partial [Rhodothermaceae bacterium]